MDDPLFTEEENKSLSRVYNKTLSLLTSRPYSEREIQNKIDIYLKKEDIDEEKRFLIKDQIIAFLKDEGLYDDESFVEDFIESMKMSSKPRSSLEIKKKLFSKGVDGGLIDRHLSSYSDEDESAALESILDKKLRNKELPLNLKEKNKTIKYLISKGFSFDKAKSAVDSFGKVK